MKFNSLSGSHPHLETRIRLRRPIIGIGAPAEIFVKRVAEALSAPFVLPSYAAVANAVGAVAGSVMITEEVIVYPRMSGDGLEVLGYTLQAGGHRELDVPAQRLVRALDTGALGVLHQDVAVAWLRVGKQFGPPAEQGVEAHGERQEGEAKQQHDDAVLEYNRVLASYFEESVAASAQYRLGRCFAALERPVSREEFEARLRAKGSLYHIHHPYHRAMYAGGLNRRQIQGWVANRYYYQIQIPIIIIIKKSCVDRITRVI